MPKVVAASSSVGLRLRSADVLLFDRFERHPGIGFGSAEAVGS
jgi:hypothetical protein